MREKQGENTEALSDAGWLIGKYALPVHPYNTRTHE